MMMFSIINKTVEKNQAIKSPNFNLSLNNYAHKNTNSSMIMKNVNKSEKTDKTQLFKAQPAKINGKYNFGAMLKRIEGMTGGCTSCGKSKK